MSEQINMPSVALVLQTASRSRLEEIAARMPTWVMASPENTPIVAELQARGLDVTLLLSKRTEMPRDLLWRAINNIEEHHGAFSGRQYGIVYLYGVDPRLVSSELPDEFSLDIQRNDERLIVLTKRVG